LYDPPGGPEWDFTDKGEDDAMSNQLSAYSLFPFEFNSPLDGTIVRIPLRTAAQAKKSDICAEETTISDVRSSMEGFATEIHHGGLLFLKSIMKVSLSIGMKHLASTEVTNKSEVIE
jgi:sacsin